MYLYTNIFIYINTKIHYCIFTLNKLRGLIVKISWRQRLTKYYLILTFSRNVFLNTVNRICHFLPI